ncbi:MAG TPA: hypothetical protein DCZ75_09315 [Geobacter sp.]|nr:hypothetical protein [Geobacter sp.]
MKAYADMSREELLQELAKKDAVIAVSQQKVEDRFLEFLEDLDLAWAENEIICDEKGQPQDYRLLRVTPGFEQETGIKFTEGKTILEIFPALDLWWIETFGKVALTGAATRFENFGEVTGNYYEVYAFSRQRGKFTTVFTNISERKEIEYALIQKQTELKLANELLEQRVRERTEELEEAIRAQESFSYSVSHDLRAPLRHMNSFSSMLVEDFGEVLPAEASRYLDRIRGASEKMGTLIDHLLELSRMSRAELNLETVDMSEIAESTMRMFRETDPARRVEQVVEPGMKVLGDSSLMRQLLENLLGNAWKYTSKKPLASIRFGRLEASGQEVYCVEDNGAGFEMLYQDKLFRPFERLHGSEFEGVGIGLATAQRIVQRHGGRIWCQGTVGQGASFYFTLPHSG